MTLTCPHCQAVFDADLSLGEFPLCPECGQTLILDDEPSDEMAQRLKEDELSALHIKALAGERRAMIRHRSHLLIIVLLCLVAAGQLVVSITHVALRPRAWQPPILTDTLLFLILYGMGLYLAAHFGRRSLRRARQLKEEYSRSALVEPGTPPDYSSLSDGSQHVRALDEMTRPTDESAGNPPAA